MKKTILATVVGITWAGAALATDPAIGVWKTLRNDPENVQG